MESHFESFLSSDGLNSRFFVELFPGHFLHRFLCGIIDSWSSQKDFRKESNAKTMFLQKSFFGESRVEFLCFLEALGVFFLTFAALETGLEIEYFLRTPWGSGMARENKATDVSAGKRTGLGPH